MTTLAIGFYTVLVVDLSAGATGNDIFIVEIENIPYMKCISELICSVVQKSEISALLKLSVLLLLEKPRACFVVGFPCGPCPEPSDVAESYLQQN